MLLRAYTFPLVGKAGLWNPKNTITNEDSVGAGSSTNRSVIYSPN